MYVVNNDWKLRGPQLATNVTVCDRCNSYHMIALEFRYNFFLTVDRTLYISFIRIFGQGENWSEWTLGFAKSTVIRVITMLEHIIVRRM